MLDIDFFVRYEINRWIYHNQKTRKHADFIISYRDLKLKPYEVFYDIFDEIWGDVDKNALRRSIELSSFENIKKRGRKKKQERGMASKSFKGEFTRLGKIKQYEKDLKDETIRYVEKKLKNVVIN